MKNCNNSHPSEKELVRTLAGRDLFKQIMLPALAFAAAVMLCDNAAGSVNLLVNGDFNAPLGSAWTAWTYGGGWANWQNDASSFDGTYYMALGGSSGSWFTSGGGVYQETVANPGVAYTLSVESGAQAWWWPHAWMALTFLDSSDTQLSTTNLETTTGITGYDTGLAWSNYTMMAIAPAGTAKVKVEFANHSGTGTAWFDDAVLTAPVPAITNVYPDGSRLMQVTNSLSFTVTASAAITNVQVVLNGVNVSGGLVIGGSAMSNYVSYAGLQTNKTYTAAITVADATGAAAGRTVNFDTFSPVFLWEAEDWDYNSRQYLNNPVPTSTAADNSYFGLRGAQGVDENETGSDPANLYRSGDPMNASPCNDVPRQKYLDAQALDPSVQDWNVGYFDAGEWVNYTRSFPAGTYNIYARLANGNGGTATVYLDEVTSGQGGANQGTASLGSFQFAAQGWDNYSYVPLLDRYGNVAEVALNGVTTLRAVAGGANMNFFMVVPPRHDLPRISEVYPDGTLLLQATNTFRFTASNPTAPIYSTNISLTLNGADSTPQLTLSGTPGSWNVTAPLALNVPRYTAVITVTDANMNVASTTIYFDTFSPTNFTWEAEDYDYSLDLVNGGLFIDNPVPTSGPAPNSYYGLDAAYGVDYYYETADPATPYTNYWRLSLGIDICGDSPPLARYVTAQLTDPSVQDYNLAWWTSNSWANYTRTYPAGTYNVYGRLASGAGSIVQLDRITGGTPSHLGQFNVPNWGWGIYSWFPLVDTNGRPVTVTLGGVSTLRATTDGNANANRFMLATPLAAVAPPALAAALSGSSVVLSFPTESGHYYEVYYKNSLGDADWTWLTALAGDGSVKSVSEPASQASRFYRLVIQ